jgi:AraC family transcriptional regulator
MGQARAAYGTDFGRNFGLENVPAIVNKALRKAPIVVTEVGASDPSPRYTDVMPQEDSYLFGLQLCDYPKHEYWEEGRQVDVHDVRAGQTTIYDLKRNPVARIDKPYHAIFFYIPRSALNAIADDAGAPRIDQLSYCPGAGVSDQTILSLGQSLHAALAAPQCASQLFVDHVTLAVGTHVAQAFGRMHPARQLPRGCLAPWQVRRAKELMSANLAGNLALSDIAKECGLSVSHFARAFRVSAGMAPYQWLLRRRVEHAKQLVVESRLSLAEVALASGFADQSHLTRVFSRIAGCSPGALRRCASSRPES